ncbi:MAG: hypothetical protein MW690_001406 [Methanophagales archaeon]|nr:hypothetical protein [Methanophagales archaeon]MCU4139474.1 hypothetical protein [Methanophagales archaeon]
MNEGKYLILLDILGFEALAKEIEEKTGVDSDEVRNKFFIDVINEKIEAIERKGIIIGKMREVTLDSRYILLTMCLKVFLRF